MAESDPHNVGGIHLTKSISSEALVIDSQASSSTLSSPKSDNKKSDTAATKNRRKRKPKKVPTSQQNDSISDNNEPMEVDNELISNNIVPIVNPEPPKHESDCETIEKIAKMVSNITSSEEKPKADTSQEVINEVENRLEEMFADVPIKGSEPVSAEQPIKIEENQVKDKPKPTKPKQTPIRKKKPEGSSKKPLKKNVNGSKSKDTKKNDKTGKSKNSDDKSIKPDNKKSKNLKENGGKAKIKSDVAPYLQIQKDGSFSIVNQTVNGDDDADKTSSKPKKPAITERNKQHIRGLHVSTLSNKYDADKRDTTWICVFCKLGPHKLKLGDLFGPYIISKNSPEYSLCLEDPANDIFRQSNRDKFTRVKSPTNAPKKKRKNSEKLASPVVNGPEVNEEVFTGMSAVDENNYEIWFHEDCIVWSQGTYIIGTKIVGMEAAVWQSTRHRCVYCHKNGAMIACLTRGCAREAHMICASKSWKLCEDFKTYCDQHL